ncbi:Sporulation lipoprotein YhcN/YlaJ-like [Syntrophomonas zehnderi OL-4]|uniref:Sporulation lipoprotein YhcN/YlaJ-like n=1 Tax=Syntrophomonas zehnderi OL-4 TaxID=690567 RepID=A0A0E4C824_9FIRM|nr:YhcN/YlaJ family sporulation lipoprotein [Syntrophomonas zehnderi]CFX23488.1 Sporulation lipoprotein YhcN/YlaJ-like [Syntrophomonas zehnderi OL-4]
MLLSKKAVTAMMTLVLGLGLFAGGCSAQKKPMENPAPPVKQPQAKMPATDDQRIAQQSAKEADSVQGVNQATAVVAGKRIYIGLDLGANMNRQQTDKVEKTVLDRVKKRHSGYMVVVTSDIDTVTRIKNVARGIGEGKPISSFTKEIQEIDNRMKPRSK